MPPNLVRNNQYMSPYGDPYQSQMETRYNGDPRQSSGLSNISNAVKGMAVGMMKFQLALMGLNFGKKVLGTAAKKHLPGIAMSVSNTLMKTPFGADVVKHTSDTYRTLANFKNIGDQVRGQVLSNAMGKESAYGSFKANWASKEKKFFNYGVKKIARIHRADALAEGRSRFYFDKARDFWKPDNLTKRVLGAAGSQVQAMAKVLPSFYVVSEALKRAEGTHGGEENTPAWYNLPGHLKNFAKFSISNAPFYLGIGFIKPAFRMAKGSMGRGLLKATEPFRPYLAKQGVKFLEEVSRNVPNIKRSERSFHNFFAELQGAGIRRFLTDPVKEITLASKAGESTWRNWDPKKVYRPSGAQLTAWVGELNKIPIGRNGEHKRFHTKAMIDGLRKRSLRQKHGIIQNYVAKMFGMKRVEYTRHELAEITKGIVRPKSRKFYTEMLGRLSKKGVSLADSGVYRDAAGKIVDLRSLDIGRNLKGLAEFLTHRIRLHIGSSINISIPGLFGSRNLYKTKPIIKTLQNKVDYAIGLHPKSNRVTGIAGDAAATKAVDAAYYLKPLKKASVNPNHAADYFQRNIDEVVTGVYTPGIDAAPGTGIYVAGKVFHYDPKLNKIVSMHPPGMEFSLQHIGGESAFAQVLQTRAGLNRMSSKYTKSKFVDKYGSLFGNLLYNFDVAKFGEGRFSRFVSAVKKYIDPNTPIGVYGNIQKALLEDTPDTVRKSLISNADRLLSRNDGFVSAKFKKHPELLKHMLGVDFTMAPAKIANEIEAIRLHPEVLGNEKLGNDIIKRYAINRITDGAAKDQVRRDFSHIARQSKTGDLLTENHQLLEFLGVKKLLSRGDMGEQIKNFDELLGTLQHKFGGQYKQLIPSLKIWSRHLYGKSPAINKHNMVKKESIEAFANQYRGLGRDFEKVTDILYKPFTRVSSENKLLEYNKFASNEFSEFVLVPKKPLTFGAVPAEEMKHSLSELQLFSDFTLNNTGPLDLHFGRLLSRFNKLWSWFGLGLDETKYDSAAQFLTKGIMARRILPVTAAVAGGWAVDKAIDANPLFEGTALDEGIGVAIGEQFVKSRMLAAKMYDRFGFTDALKYSSGLMPGSVDSPLARAIRTWAPITAGAKIGGGFGGPVGAGYGMLVGTGLAATHGFGMFDLTRKAEELEEIYSGREYVPIRKSRWWELGSGNYMGGSVEAMRPNWFARLKSKYKNTPDGLGSPLEQLMYQDAPFLDWNPLGHLLGPDHYAFKRYYSQPFPQTDVPFAEFPFVGPSIAGTVGRLIKPPKMMHESEMEMYAGTSAWNPSQRFNAVKGTAMFDPKGSEVRMPGEANAIDYSSARNVIDTQVYNMEKALGLWGFGSARVSQNLMGRRSPFASQAVMASAGEITSFRRAYWDQTIGGLAGTTELFRRFVPQERYERKVSAFNPLINTQPSWMPHRFHIGSPTAVIKEAEFRLPGRGYESARDVRMTYPVSADVLGLTTPDMVRKMLGLYPQNINPYESDMHRKSQQIAALATIYDSFMNISSSMDQQIKYGRQKVAMKIKDLSEDELRDFIGPAEQDISEMNFILRQTGSPAGLLQYQFNGRPIAMHGIKYSERRWERDKIRLSGARQIAQDLYNRGLGFGGEGYSHIDRLKVLADVSPWSGEYKREKNIVQAQLDAGYDIENELIKIERIRKTRMMREELYPYRFSADKILTPDAEINNMSLNANIKAAADYPLTARIAGGIWEGFCLVNDQEIFTSGNMKLADDINIGDELLDKNGKFIKVSNIYKRLKYNNEEVYKIKLWKNTTRSLKVTGNHEVLVSTIIPKHKHWKRTYNEEELCWKKASDLDIDDFLVFPKVIGNKQIDHDLCRLYGYYLAEGSIKYSRHGKPSGVLFSFHKDEVKYHDDVKYIIRKIFNKDPKIYNSGLNCISIGFFDKDLVTKYFLNNFDRYSHKKKLPKWVFELDENCIKNILLGYIRGDGHFRKDGYNMSSVSKDLIDGIKQLFINIGIYPSIHISKPRDRKTAYILSVVGDDARKFNPFNEVYNYRHRSCSSFTFETDNYILVKVKSVEKVDYDGYVYDFETNGSYLTSTGIVHNSHMDTPLHTKFLHVRTPRESYERSLLYGRDVKMWFHPIDHFADAFRRGFMSKTTPFQGSVAGAIAGTIMGGVGLPSVLGGVVGATYGGIHGVFRNMTGEAYIPGNIQEGRNINRYFDKTQYEKNMMMYQMSGETAYLEEAKGTMAGIYATDKSSQSWSTLYRATPPQEKKYLFSLLSVTDENERQTIYKALPEDLAEQVRSKWGTMDGKKMDMVNSYTSANLPAPHGDWAGWSPDIELDDVKMKTIDKEGLMAHDFGLGWERQRRRVASDPNIPGPIDMADTMGSQHSGPPRQSKIELRRSIEMLLNRSNIQGTISVTPNYGDNTLVVVNK